MCLKEEFKNYLIFNKLSDASVKKYSEQVPSFIKKNFGIDIYEYCNVKELENFIQTIKKDASFVEANKTGNSMYLAGIKHYLEFVRQNVILLFNSAVSASLKDTHEERLKRLQRVNKVKKCTCKCIVYDRNPDVVAERLYIAGGYCEECKQKAPFLRKSDGTPYLEVHHIVPLSMNGEDTIENTIALCPNCHRKKHYG